MAKHDADQLPGADARLVALLAELIRQDAVIEAIEGEELPPGPTPTSEDQEARLALANDVRDGIIQEITATPARSAAGLRAKAQATMMILDSGIASSAEASNDQLAFALAVDVLAETPAIQPALLSQNDEVLILGLRLAAAIKEEESLADRQSAVTDVTPRIYLEDAWLHATDEAAGLRDMIATTTASSLAGAAVQIVQAIERCSQIRGSEGPNYKYERAIMRLLYSALDVVADASGATDPRFGELIALNEHMNPWAPVEHRCKALAEVEP